MPNGTSIFYVKILDLDKPVVMYIWHSKDFLQLYL